MHVRKDFLSRTDESCDLPGKSADKYAYFPQRSAERPSRQEQKASVAPAMRQAQLETT